MTETQGADPNPQPCALGNTVKSTDAREIKANEDTDLVDSGTAKQARLLAASSRTPHHRDSGRQDSRRIKTSTGAKRDKIKISFKNKYL
ncbi:MAG TPA: hypothetical protein VK663_08555 [Burkholderiales bacterium]|nr:hypothetical protein [Burkholderiales bacterium]